MPRYFDFSNDEYQFDGLSELRTEWSRVPDTQARNAIAEAHQYYRFLRVMIVERIQSWSHPRDEREHWFTPTPLALSARAGAVSSAIVVGASIVECAMRAHAESRRIKKLLKVDPRHRTFGKVVHIWEKDRTHAPEIAPVLSDLERLVGVRNNIHLYASFGRDWQDVLNEEHDLLQVVDRLIHFFKNL